jgi:hypothetical protein
MITTLILDFISELFDLAGEPFLFYPFDISVGIGIITPMTENQIIGVICKSNRRQLMLRLQWAIAAFIMIAESPRLTTNNKSV